MPQFYIIIFLSVIILQQSLFSQQIHKHNTLHEYELKGGVYDNEIIRTIHIDFYNSNYDSLLNNFWQLNKTNYLPAKFELDGQKYDSVGVRYKGNSTYYIAEDFNNPKKPLNIDLNYYNKNQNINSITKLKLANAILDPTFLRETIASAIYKKYMPSPEVNLIKVNINGNYLGLYVNVESVNENFLIKHYGMSDGTLIKCDPVAKFKDSTGTLWSSLDWRGKDSSLYYESYSLKTNYGWTELMELINVLNFQEDKIETILDVDKVLWYFALNSILLNLDTYNNILAHNFYLYQSNDKVFNIIPWDLSESFVNVFLGLTYPKHKHKIELLHCLEPYYPDRPLVSKILSNDLYKKQYFAHIRTIVKEIFDEGYLDLTINRLSTLVDYHAKHEEYSLFTYKEHKTNLDSNLFLIDENLNKYFMFLAGIKNTAKLRYDYIIADTNYKKIPPIINDVNYLKVSQIVTAEVSNASKVELLNDFFENDIKYSSNFIPYQMKDDGLYPDKIKGDGIYSILLPISNNNQNIILNKFYIRASNNDAVSLKPERAEFEYFTIQPEPKNLVINELLSQNENTIKDNENEYDDWIELYNNSNEDIFLGEYYMSDNFNSLKKWKLPNSYIKANDYEIIWADKDDTDYHTNFKLSSKGEWLILSNSNSEIIDKVRFLKQDKDISFARYPNGKGNFNRMKPTFLSENNDFKSAEINNDESQNIKCFPNPFNHNTTIRFNLDNYNHYKLTIYDNFGRIVYILFDGYLSKGGHEFQWNGTNQSGIKLNNGVYNLIISEQDNEKQKLKGKVLIMR